MYEDKTRHGVSRTAQKYLPTWKTVNVGQSHLGSVRVMRRSLRRAGCKVGAVAEQMLNSRAFKINASEREVDLVVVSIADLGFTDDAMLRDIVTRAREFGLTHCLHEVAPLLRIEYKYQPRGESLVVVSEPVTLGDKHPRVFKLTCDRVDRWLCGIDGNPTNTWSVRIRFVFMRQPTPIPSFLWSV